MDLMDEEELNRLNIQFDNDEKVSRALEMDGLQISNQPLRLTRTNNSMKVKDILQLLEKHLKIKEEALSRVTKTEGQRKVHCKDKETEKKPKIKIKIEEKLQQNP